MKKDPLREKIEEEKQQTFLAMREKKNRWIPLVCLGIALLGLLVVINAIVAPAYAPYLWDWIKSLF